MSKRQILGEKKDVGDGLNASWDDLTSALLRRWPSEYQYVIPDFIEIGGEDGDNFVICAVRIPLELVEELNQIANEASEREDGDQKVRAMAIFRDMERIFSRLADACDE